MPKFILSLTIICLALLVACTRNHDDQLPGNTASLAGLQAMANVQSKKTNRRRHTNKIKETALREAALSIGAQAGLAWRARMIDDQLTRLARRLDAIYDFNALILEHNILPPVLLEGRNAFNLADAQTIRISNRTYKIAKQARFVTTTPNWRQYLWLDYQQPEYPNVGMLPKTRREKQVWSYYVQTGWKNGVEQAATILEESIARIKEDYVGMILYRKLLAMNMVSPPFVSHTDLGVTGDSNELRIDDRVLRITALPLLNVNPKEWIAPVAKDENALEQFKNMEKLAQNTKIIITSKAWQPVIAPVNTTDRNKY
ncbi:MULTISPECIES: type IV secretion system DotC family protein [Legionella]|uniref:Defect in organelle trafficking lipoprotein DotC n=1 Tax=Legionella drozanskii LLAP-1 TaxID=1212489 RepID=A0A0W0SVK8_9GAMM|nr:MULTISPECIES: type IV secretion system DotC family protein [Legionella]KTC87418.1 defect in organelle trafficking lipoprotein DotC [Legionella drozanskii LLAP-1]PJE08609.1 MAG: type IV secretion system protein DotC [Legionella sp.]